MDVAHVAVWVSDLAASRAFYEDALGLRHEKDFVGPDGVTNYFVRGATDALLQFKYDPDGSHAVEPSGIAHVALAVSDVDEAFERAVEQGGARVVQLPTTHEALGVRNAFVEDPDGYVVELEETV